MMRIALASLLGTLWIFGANPAARAVSPTYQTVQELLQKSYLELLELDQFPTLTPGAVKEVQDQYKREKETERSRLKKKEEQLEKDLKAARKQLDELNRRAGADADKRRNVLRCEVLRLESELKKTRTERQKGLPLIYQNKAAKLDLLQKWPAVRARVARETAEGTARSRRYGNVEDIGIRNLGIENLGDKQQGDVRTGQDAIHDMRTEGLMPAEIDDKEVSQYVRDLAESLARNSDLKVPIKATVLDSMEINAFALPGGFLFVNSGLINRAETESELAGVLAHEIAHAAARHGPRLMKRAKIMDLIFQAAQVSAGALSGGAASAALQYGFFGVGMVLDLSLLGVSREFEAEADQLGAQYAWHAGFDPKGFITFFDKMANEEGYVKSTSFFRTHPPFLERIISTFSEITYLPAQASLRFDSSAFVRTKQRIATLTRQREREAKDQPALRGEPPICGEAKE